MAIIPEKEISKLSKPVSKVMLEWRRKSLNNLWLTCLEQTHYNRAQALEMYEGLKKKEEARWVADTDRYNKQSRRYVMFTRKKRKPYLKA